MITTEIDLSPRFGVARDQGQRPTCLVFAGSDLNAVANSVGHLSTEFLCYHAAEKSGCWKPGQGFQLDHVLAALRAPGQPLEARYPYQPNEHEAPLTEPTGEFELHASLLARRQSMAVKEVVDCLKGGAPIGLVIQVGVSLMKPTDGVIDFDPFVLPDQYHAVVGVGVGADPDTGNEYVLLRNSWGESWGLSGHAWMPRDLLELLLVDSFLI